MIIDIEKLDNWLLHNKEITQDEREIIIETLIEYDKIIKGGKK